jgi:hypothetical protein
MESPTLVMKDLVNLKKDHSQPMLGGIISTIAGKIGIPTRKNKNDMISG